jgi:hypothetical protein
MSAHANPDIIDDGLVFLYDTDDGKSYKGEPTENLVPVGDRTLTTVLQRQSYHYAPWTYSLETNINGRADVLKIYINPTGSESSQPYADFGFQAYKSGGSQVGDVYAVSFDYYVPKSTNTPSLLVAYANGYKSPTSASAATLGTYTTTDLGNGWVRATRITTITTAGNTHWRFGLNSNYDETEVYVDNFQVELKSHATPFVDGTRSNTQGLLDRTGNSTIDLSPASYDSNAQITFDGTDDYITIGSDSVLQDIGSFATIECWFKSSSLVGSKFAIMVGWGDGTSYYSNFGIGNWFSAWSDESIYVGINSSAVVYAERDGSAKYHDGNWHHAVALMGHNNHKIYVDGSEVSVSFAYGSNSVSTSKLFGFSSGTEVYIGLRPYGNGHFQGDLPVVKIYNRLLSDDEILQNFNATKSRFGL